MIDMLHRSFLLLLFLLCPSANGADCFVSPSGNDASSGTLEKPFQTLRKAADTLSPGDTCFVRAGTYRESVTLRRSGKPGAPIRFLAFPGEQVILDGTDPIQGSWSMYKGSILKTRTRLRFEQLFAGRKMLLEARWPNTSFDRLLTRDGWATTGPKSAYQTLHDPELAETGIDWNGATAILNIAHQFWTWSRPVLNYTKGSDTFNYAIKMNEFHSKRTHWWADDFYYLLGKLEALDSPGEWFLSQDGTLYLWPPAGATPARLQLEAKTREYAFQGKGIRHIEISGFHFFACTFSLLDAEHCMVEHCNLLFPSFARGVPEADEPSRKSAGTVVTGKDNLVRSCSLVHCGNFGIKLSGQRNAVENCLIHDVNWSGTLRYSGIALSGGSDDARPMNAARHNTVYGVGNAIIVSGRNRYGTIEYNHVHHGGLLSKDVSLIYTSMPYAMGNEIRYNWVHDSLSPSNSLGIRGDDKTRGMRVHHNVVWNCRRDGIIAKGGKNLIYNNTCFSNGAADILFCSGREPDKWWQEHVKAYEHQNEDSMLFNNCANVIVSTRSRREPGLPGDHSNNDTSGAPKLADPDHLDFRPGKVSPLVDKGRAVEGVTAPFAGKAPDIGAYEFGMPRWLPGHHNEIAFSRSPGGSLQACLALPISRMVSVHISSKGRSFGALSFTPSDWMTPRKIKSLPRSNEQRGIPLRFESSDWGAAILNNSQAVGRLAPAWAAFKKPDLSSAESSGPKFSYEEVYQPARGRHPAARAFRLSRPVKIDGRLAGNEWPGWSPERALLLVSLKAQPEAPVPPAGTALVLYDDENLYVAFSLIKPGGTKLKRTGGQWGRDNGVELDFRSVVRKRPGPAFVLHGFPSGRFESTTDAGATATEAKQLSDQVEYAAAAGKNGWTAEFRVPFKALGATPHALDHLQFNVGARLNGAAGGPWFAWKNTRGANYDVEHAARLLFLPAVPASGRNLLTNSGFESPDLSPWQLAANSRSPIPEGTAVRVREGRDRGWCIRLHSSDRTAMKTRVFKWTHPLPKTLPPGVYHLSYDVRVKGLVPLGKIGSFNSYLHVKKNNRPGGNIGQVAAMLTERDLDWTRRTFTLLVPEGVKPSMLSLQLHQATGTVWIDNVLLVPCEKN